MINEKRKLLFADIVLLMVAAIWGGGFVAGKMALTSLSPIAVLVYRFCGAALCLGILFAGRIRKNWRSCLKYGIIIGCLQFAALLIQLIALQYTTPAKQSFLAASYVIFTPLAAWVLSKTKPEKKDAAAAILAFIGVAFISLNNDLSIQIGDPLTLLFAVVFSMQIVYTAKFVKNVDTMVMTFFQFCTSAVFSILAVLVTQTPIHCQGMQSIGGVIYLTFINTALAICLQNSIQRYAKESHTALILSLESVFGFLFAVCIYHDPVTLRMVVGCVIVLVALFIHK